MVPHGPTRTAKGTFLDAIGATLGDYAVAAELDLLAERNRAGGPQPDWCLSAGLEWCHYYETSRRLRLSASLLKTLCGSDPVTCRDLYAKPMSFRPQCTVWIPTNYHPSVPGDDDALWARLRELPVRRTDSGGRARSVGPG